MASLAEEWAVYNFAQGKCNPGQYPMTWQEGGVWFVEVWTPSAPRAQQERVFKVLTDERAEYRLEEVKRGQGD